MKKKIIFIILALIIIGAGAYGVYKLNCCKTEPKVMQDKMDENIVKEEIPEQQKMIAEILAAVKKDTGINFSEEDAFRIKWQAIEGADVIVEGREFGASEIPEEQYEKLEDVFLARGFNLSAANSSEQNGNEIIGYQNENIACRVFMNGKELKEVRVGCGFSEHPFMRLDEKDIMTRKLFADKYDRDIAEISTYIVYETDNYMRGTVRMINGVDEKADSGLFLAVKSGDDWELVHDGHGAIPCEEMEEYGFPKGMIIECYQSPVEEIDVKAGDEFEITLDANPTTGYRWEIDYNEARLEFISREYLMDSQGGLVGAGGKEIFKFKAVNAGSGKIEFSYMRPWEKMPSELIPYIVNVE